MNYELRIKNHEFDKENLTEADKWILNKLNSLIKDVSDDLDNYGFSQAGEKLREFTWNDFADWYLEVSKFEKNKEEILVYVLENLLKLWHPFMPFVTETIWENLGKEEMLIVSEFPKAVKIKNSGVSKFNLIKNIIVEIRNARSENKVEPAKKVKAIIYAGKSKKLIESQAELIKNLRTGIKELEIKEKGEKIDDAIFIAVCEMEIYLIGAVDKEKEKERIKKEVANLEKAISGIESKLKNKNFIERAPEKIVKQEKERLENYKAELKKLK